MAPRRGLRNVKTVNNINYSNISLNDVLCPICRCILIQPVTLPCNHDFCLPCFDGTLANANLTCPLCRVRFSSWHRIAKKDNKIVNARLWDVLKDKFPGQVKNRLQGVEENLEEETVIKLTKPGEIRKEYELQKHKEELEFKKLKEIEEKASAELIRKLKEQEEYEASLRDEKLRLDERVARQLAKEMGFLPKPSVSNVVVVAPKKRRPVVRKGTVKKDPVQDMPQFISNLIKEKNAKQKNLTNLSVEVSDSNDSIENECKYFKPFDHRNIPPSNSNHVLVRVPVLVNKIITPIVRRPNENVNFAHGRSLSAFALFHPEEPLSPIIGAPLHQTASPAKAGRKRKYSETKTPERKLESSDCVKNVKSPPKQKPESSVKSPPKNVLGVRKRPNIRNHLGEKTRMMLRERKFSGSPLYGFDSPEKCGEDQRLKQEKDDLEFAKKLQEQFNKERYSTRSSISCRSNIKKPRQVTLTEIITTSKCK